MKRFGKVGMLLAFAALAGIATAAVNPPVKNVRTPAIKAPAASTTSSPDRAPAASTRAVKAGNRTAVARSNTGTAAYLPTARPKPVRPALGRMDRRATAYSPHQMTQKTAQPATSHNKRLHKSKAVVLQHGIKANGAKASYTICNQNFETDWTGWTAYNSTGNTFFWSVGTTTALGTSTPPSFGTQYAYYSDDAAGSGNISVDDSWISPAFAVPAVATLNFQYGWGFRIYQTGEVLHALVHVCQTGVWGNWDTLVTYTATGAGTATFDLSAYLPADSIQVKWVYNDQASTSHWGWAAGVDNVLIVGTNPENHDVRPQALTTPNPAGWLTPGTLITPAAVAQNVGLDTAFSFEVHLLIDSAGVNLYSAMRTVDTLAPGGTIPVTFTDWTPGPAMNTYNFTLYTVYSLDADSTNDTLRANLITFQEVTTINSPYTTTVPTCDGAINAATEWADAVKIDMSDVYNMAGSGVFPPGSCFLYVKNDNNNIYFAVDGVADATYISYDQIGLYFDDNHNGAWEASPDTTEGNINIGDQGGAGIYSRWITSGPTYGSWTSRTGLFPVGYGIGSGHQQYEAAVPISSVCDPARVATMPGMSVGFWTMAIDNNASTQYGWWPQSNATWNNPAGYGTLTLGTSGLPDAAIMAIRAPAGVYAPSAIVNPVGKVGNIGPAPADFMVHCVIDTNGTPVYADSQNVTALASMDTALVTFTQWNMPADQGTYHITMYVTYGSDTNPANDTLASRVFIFQEQTDINSPYTTVVPTCDGNIDVATEWADAVKVDISDVYNASTTGAYPPRSCYLYIKNDNSNIYVAVDDVVDATAGTGYDQMGLYFDDNHNGVWEASPDTTEGNNTIGNFGGIGLYTRWITSGPTFGGWVARTGLYPVGYGTTSGHEQFEAAIPLGSQTDPGHINAMPGGTVGLYAMCTDDDAGTQPGYWPQSNPAWNDPAAYGPVKLGTSGLPDVAAMMLYAPTGIYSPGGSATPMAKVGNLGPAAADFSVHCVIDSNGTVVYTDSQSVAALASMDTADVSFALWNIPAQPANFNVTLYVAYAGDTYPANDTLHGTCASSFRFWETWTPYTQGWSGAAETGLNNRLYMFGGIYSGGSPTNQIAIFDKATDTWSTSAATLSSVNYFGYAVPARGKIFMTGGSSGWPTPIANVDCYSPDGDSVNPRTALPTATMDHVACVWRDSLIYVLGGGNWGMTPQLNNVQVYDIVNDSWSAGTALPVAVGTGVGTILGDTIVISCGYTGSATAATYLGVIDPATPTTITWSATTDYPGGAAYRVLGGYISDANNHELLVAGGQPGAGVLAASYSYSIGNGWTAWYDKTTPCGGVRGGGQVGDHFVICGGYNGSTYIANTEALQLWWPTGVADKPMDQTLPARFALQAPRPNPVAGRTTICYQLPARAGTSLTIYNIAGQKVKTLASGVQEAGIHQVSWNCDNDAGRKVSAGIYLYRLQSGKSQATKKVTVLR